MLPSGNDAAITLAENFSEKLKAIKNRTGVVHRVVEDRNGKKDLQAINGNKSYSVFVKEMNK